MALSLAEAYPRSRRHGSLQSRPVAPPALRGMDRDDLVARREHRREVRGRRRAGGADAGATIVVASTLSRGSLNSTNDIAEFCGWGNVSSTARRENAQTLFSGISYSPYRSPRSLGVCRRLPDSTDGNGFCRAAHRPAALNELTRLLNEGGKARGSARRCRRRPCVQLCALQSTRRHERKHPAAWFPVAW